MVLLYPYVRVYLTMHPWTVMGVGVVILSIFLYNSIYESLWKESNDMVHTSPLDEWLTPIPKDCCLVW